MRIPDRPLLGIIHHDHDQQYGRVEHAHKYLIEPISTSDFQHKRNELLSLLARQYRSKYLTTRDISLLYRAEGTIPDVPALDFGGIVVSQEMEAVMSSISSPKRFNETEISDILDKMGRPHQSILGLERKVVHFDTTKNVMNDYPGFGLRIVMVMDSPDSDVSSSPKVLDTAGKVAGPFGLVVALIAGEKEMNARGINTPIEERVVRVAANQSVDFVSVMPDPVDLTPAGLRYHYDDLHQLTHPHFRITRKEDSQFSVIQNQCCQNGIGIIYIG